MHRSGFQAFRRTGVTFISPAGIGYLCAPRSGAQTVVVVRCWELVLGALSLRWGGQRSYHHRLSEDAAARGGHDGRRLARRAGGKFMEDSMAQAAASSGRTRRHAGVESQGGKSDLRVCVTVNGQVGGGCCAANLRYLATPTAYQWHGHASFTVSAHAAHTVLSLKTRMLSLKFRSATRSYLGAGGSSRRRSRL